MNTKEEIALIKEACERLIEREAPATLGPWTCPSDVGTHLVSVHSRNHHKNVCDFPSSSGELEQYRIDRLLTTEMREFSAPAARALLLVLETVQVEEVLEEIVKQWKGKEK